MQDTSLLKVSIAMCTYNGANYISEQLRSLLAQTRLPDEIIICDDNSTDETVQIILEMNSSLIKLQRNTTNLGSTLNFQQALHMCTGDIIFLADQDDIWNCNKIETMLPQFAKENVGIVFSNATVVDHRLNPIGSLWELLDLSAEELLALSNGNGPDVLARRSLITGMCMAVRREALEGTFPFVPLWVHDEWIAFIVSATWSIVPINEPLALYRQHVNQQIGVKKKSFCMRLRDQITDGSIKRCRGRADRLSLILNRLSQLQLKDSGLLERLNDRIDHWHVRLALPHNKWKRLKAIQRELHRYVCYESKLIALKDWLER